MSAVITGADEVRTSCNSSGNNSLVNGCRSSNSGGSIGTICSVTVVEVVKVLGQLKVVVTLVQ